MGTEPWKTSWLRLLTTGTATHPLTHLRHCQTAEQFVGFSYILSHGIKQPCKPAHCKVIQSLHSFIKHVTIPFPLQLTAKRLLSWKKQSQGQSIRSKLRLINISPVTALSKTRETLCGDTEQHKLCRSMWVERRTTRLTCKQLPAEGCSEGFARLKRAGWNFWFKTSG